MNKILTTMVQILTSMADDMFLDKLADIVNKIFVTYDLSVCPHATSESDNTDIFMCQGYQYILTIIDNFFNSQPL